MRVHAPRIIVAATRSGAGKTTVTCGLLRALVGRGLRVQAAKCGPDYLDPLFHQEVLGTPSRNLDLFLGNAALARQLVAEGARHAELTLVEGVMGYYDGIACSHRASTYDVACALNAPVVLVVDARGRALSVAAEVVGFMQLRQPSHIAGVVLNHVSESYYPLLKEAVERETGVCVLGYVPHLSEAELPSRHLGLVAPAEIADLRQKLDSVAAKLSRTIDLDKLIRIAITAEDLEVEPWEDPSSQTPHDRPIVAVARDAAFAFYYTDALALLERLGAQLAFFSPLEDEALPKGTSGLYLGGGYPELHAKQLSKNAPMLECVRAAVRDGMPTIAECGGFMYLQESLEDDHGTSWPMVGALEGRSFGKSRLVRFGYVSLEAQQDGLLANRGNTLCAHEFHYWDSTAPGKAFCAQKPQSERGWITGVHTRTLYAGYPHLYLPAHQEAARRFVDACTAFATSFGRRAQ